MHISHRSWVEHTTKSGAQQTRRITGAGADAPSSLPRGTERLRFTPGPAHSEAMMDELTGALVEIWDRMELKLKKAA